MPSWSLSFDGYQSLRPIITQRPHLHDIGLMLATVEIDLLTGLVRFTFGIPKLMEGFDIIVVVIGLFAVSEILDCPEQLHVGEYVREKVSPIWLSMKDFLDSIGAILTGTFLGFFRRPYGTGPSPDTDDFRRKFGDLHAKPHCHHPLYLGWSGHGGTQNHLQGGG